MRRWGRVGVVAAVVVAALAGYAVGARRATTPDEGTATPPAEGERHRAAAWVQEPMAVDESGATTIHVAPDGTGDACTIDRPCPVAAGQAAARAAAATGTSDVVVSFGDGTYALPTPIVLGPQDGGRNGHLVAYRAAPGATPVLDAGIPVPPWQVGADGTWTASLPPGTTTRQLWVDGRRAVRARGPVQPAGWSRTADGFLAPDEQAVAWRRPQDVEIVSHAEWRDDHCPVAAVAGREVTMAQPCWRHATGTTVHPMEEVTWVENAPELLNEPGEWYLDPSDGRLTYRPGPGEDPATTTAVLGGAESAIEIRGTAGDPVERVVVSGLTVRHTGWSAPSTPAGYPSAQSGWHQGADAGPDPLDLERTPGAVRLAHAHHVRLEGMTIEHVGAVGLDLEPGCQDVALVGNRVRDTSSTGIQIGDGHQGSQNPPAADQLDRIQVANNLVTGAGAEFADGAGIFVAYASNLSLLHNELAHLPHSGISIGWGWGTDSYARNIVVLGNRISDVVTTLQDGGAIYTLSPLPGTIIERNHITDQRNRSGAIFLDEGTAFVTVADNVVERSPRWLHIWSTSIHDNVVVDNATDTAELRDAGARTTRARNVTDPGQWPPAAREVIDEAGLEPAFAHLRTP